MTTLYEQRYAYHPADFKAYDTGRIRKEFLIEKLMDPGYVRLVHSSAERFITGGVVPVDKPLSLEAPPQLKAEFFCQRREAGVINVGGPGIIVVDGKEYKMNFKDALYIGKGSREVLFIPDNPGKPAHFYLNSAPAHKAYPTKHVTMKDANVLNLGSATTANERTVNQLLINGLVETCQLQMGMTELRPGSVWNTMPPHLHSRRNEVYFYFNVPEGQSVCHFMGQPDETRHIWLQNEQAVISPEWSIHAAAGTSNYTFIWGMAGENLDYTDMDIIAPAEIR